MIDAPGAAGRAGAAADARVDRDPVAGRDAGARGRALDHADALVAEGERIDRDRVVAADGREVARADPGAVDAHESLALARAAGDDYGICRSLNDLANIVSERGDYAGAVVTLVLVVAGLVTPLLQLRGKVNKAVGDEMANLHRRASGSRVRLEPAAVAAAAADTRSLETRLDEALVLLRMSYLERLHGQLGYRVRQPRTQPLRARQQRLGPRDIGLQ